MQDMRRPCCLLSLQRTALVNVLSSLLAERNELLALQLAAV